MTTLVGHTYTSLTIRPRGHAHILLDQKSLQNKYCGQSTHPLQLQNVLYAVKTYDDEHIQYIIHVIKYRLVEKI